ncbi:MAG TPA: type II/IV secretion system ATPase subunit [Nitrososphaerales archaeon]|nr:type II/IV secretion system ATPase subunit [Nitrososphaerales archaeon]
MEGLGKLIGARSEQRGAINEPPLGKVETPEMIGGVIDTYRVPSSGGPDSSAQIFVVDDGGAGKYLVRSPRLSPDEEALLKTLRSGLFDSIPLGTDGDPKKVVDSYLSEFERKPSYQALVKSSHDRLLYHLMREFAGFWEIDPLMNDDNLEEISVTRSDKPVRVLHRGFSEYMFMETDVVYPSEERLEAFIRRLAQLGGTNVSLAQPSLEVTLQGTSDKRVTATLGDEISRPGSSYAIRKQRERSITLAQLAATEPARWVVQPAATAESPPAYDEVHSHKTLSVLMAAYFWLLLDRTSNILIAGETNSGKTTLMNAILALTNPKAKVVTAEDVLEISLPDHLHWERLKTRSYRAGLTPSNSRFEYGLSDLLKIALRFSPTILSLGEMRGEESETLAAAITLGFSTMTTLHAEDAQRCVQRLTTPPMRFSVGHVRDITAIATVKKVTMGDGRVVRRVTSVDEIRPTGRDSYEILNIFWYDPSTDSFGPTTPAEVLDRSFRLNEIADITGKSPRSVQDDLAARAAGIGERIDKRQFTPQDLSTMVSRLSAQTSRTSERV